MSVSRAFCVRFTDFLLSVFSGIFVGRGVLKRSKNFDSMAVIGQFGRLAKEKLHPTLYQQNGLKGPKWLIGLVNRFYKFLGSFLNDAG